MTDWASSNVGNACDAVLATRMNTNDSKDNIRKFVKKVSIAGLSPIRKYDITGPVKRETIIQGISAVRRARK